jgi:uncharacterized protein (TIGR02217 family)
MAFLEERVNVAAKYGASYGDAYNVEISTTSGGSEYRRLVHPYPVRRFRFAYMLDAVDVYTDLVNLYHRAFGRYAGFRVKCMDDYTSNGTTGTPTNADQTLIYISSGVYQLVKQYGAGSTPLSIGRPSRIIYKPVSGTVVIAKNGTAQPSGWTVDTTTGRVTFSSAPLITDVISGGFEFDIPVRFDTDMDISINYPTARDIESIELVELLNP